MPDRDEIISRICWGSSIDPEALATVAPTIIESTIEKLAQPLANYLIQYQVLEKEGLWEKTDYTGLLDAPTSNDDESQKLRTYAEAALAVMKALEDIPMSARAPLLQQFIPHLEKEIARKLPEYRFLVYETKQAIKGREVQKKEDTKRAKTDNRVFWVVSIILIGIYLLIEFKTGFLLGLDNFSAKFTAASGWSMVWLIARIPLAVLAGFAFFGTLAIWISGLFRKAADTWQSVQPIDLEKYRTEEQNWVWICQRCEHLEPFLGEDDLDCPNCNNRMTRVRGQWGH